MIDFNYNSNHLEGNTLSYGQTKLLLLFGDTTGNVSMQDYEEAIDDGKSGQKKVVSKSGQKNIENVQQIV